MRAHFRRWARHKWTPLLAHFAVGLAVLAAAGCSAAARADALDPARRAQLEQGTVEQRAEVLGWLAEHGDPGSAHAAVLRLKDENEGIRGLAEQTLWSIWTRSGTTDVDRLMEKGIALMGERETEAAVAVFDEIVRRRPDFAEGYNKRATVLYMLGDYLRSLEDVERTLRLNPEHFGALSGGGLCLLKLQRLAEALQYFDRALEVNPNMDSIRFMADQLRKQKPKPVI